MSQLNPMQIKLFMVTAELILKVKTPRSLCKRSQRRIRRSENSRLCSFLLSICILKEHQPQDLQQQQHEYNPTNLMSPHICIPKLFARPRSIASFNSTKSVCKQVLVYDVPQAGLQVDGYTIIALNHIYTYPYNNQVSKQYVLNQFA